MGVEASQETVRPKTPWRVRCAVVASGMLAAASFPGHNLWYLAWFSLVPLMLVLDRASPRQGFWRAYVAGLVYFGIVLSWMAGLVHWVGIIVLPGIVLLVAFMALYWAMFGWVYCRLRRVWPWAPVLVGPFVWVVLEYLQSRLFTGFGWGLIGYSQIFDLPVAHCATLGGIYLVSGIVVAVNLCLAAAICRRPRWWTGLAAAAGLAVVAHGLGYVLMHNLPSNDSYIDVGIVQGNIPIEVSYDPHYNDDVMYIQERLTRNLIAEHRRAGDGSNVRLVIWPESALPDSDVRPDSRYGLRAAQVARRHDMYLLAGGIRQEHNGSRRIYNTAFMFDPEGRMVDVYDKVHLTPYGEYIPLGKFMPFLGKAVQIADMSSGNEMKVFHADAVQFGALICFETLFPELSRQLVNRGSQFLVVISNLAWFGQGAAREQEFAISRFRAIENHVPVIRAANTGISGIIGPDGRLMRVLPAGAAIGGYRAGISCRVPLAEPGSPGTFYTRHGDVFVLLSAAIVAAACAVHVVATRRRSK